MMSNLFPDSASINDSMAAHLVKYLIFLISSTFTCTTLSQKLEASERLEHLVVFAFLCTVLTV